jgi:hypothetical protein
LRNAAASPDRALTMVHAADDGADLVRELGVFCSWLPRRQLVAEAARRLAAGTAVSLEPAVRAIEAGYPPVAVPGPLPGLLPGLGGLLTGPRDRRWAAVRAASGRWPLVSRSPSPAWWPLPGAQR